MEGELPSPFSNPTCIGVLLAAGRGRRMGGTKQLLPWPGGAGSKPLVAAAYDAIRPACVQMVVVVGHKADAVTAALEHRSFRSVLSDPDAELFHSIRAGLQEAQAIDPTASILLHPGDHPEVLPSSLAAILLAHDKAPHLAIMPEFHGRGGHPVLIPPPIVRRLLSEDCPAGLGSFWRENPLLYERIAIDDPSIVHDIDTPADFTS
jgi:molybdenum cofactor cytidylyltransferase